MAGPGTYQARDKLTAIALASIVVALAVMGLKFLAWAWTGSVALYSDALESLVNVTTGVAALAAIRISTRPADRNHQFGHHKAEYFSAVVEGALIIVAALLIMREAYHAIQEPRALNEATSGLAVSGLATVVNGAWSWYLITMGRRLRSPALVADGWHLFSDVATSVGVLIGLILAALTGWTILDPLIAGAVAIHILWIGWDLMQGSASSLMDKAVAADVAKRIQDVIGRNADGALQVHDIRTRVAGAATFIEFHLVVPSEMTVKEAHDICDRLEEALESTIAGAEVMIHVEPAGEAKQKGALVL